MQQFELCYRKSFFLINHRVDGLNKREESPTEMIEHFINRDDYLYYRHVNFGVREKKVAPATMEGFPRPIMVCNEGSIMKMFL